MNRKILSLTKFKGFLIALCDDGTIWSGKANPLTGTILWIRMEDIPHE